MIRINLLPVKISKRQEAVRNELVVAAGALAVIILVLVGVQVAMSAKVNGVDAENASLKREIQHKQQILDEVEAMEKLREELEKKLAVIGQLERNKTGPVMMLDQLSQATPEKLQLQRLDEKNGRVQLTGVAVSNEVISQFLSNLEKSPRFTDVYLNAIDQVEVAGVKLKDFSITAKLVQQKRAPTSAEEAAGAAPTPDGGEG